MVYSEADLIIPALVYMSFNDEGVLTSDLIAYLDFLLKPEGRDIEIIASRSDTYFSQKVRNLVSHRSLVNKGFATYETIGSDNLNKITEIGRKYISSNMDGFDFVESNGFSDDDRKMVIEKDFANLVIEEGFVTFNHVKKRSRSKKLVEIAKDHFRIGDKICCVACNFNFEDFYGEIGKDFIEMHHLKPIFAYDNNFQQSIVEALNNIVPVCSNCHRIIHRQRLNILPIDELKDVIERQKILVQ